MVLVKAIELEVTVGVELPADVVVQDEPVWLDDDELFSASAVSRWNTNSKTAQSTVKNVFFIIPSINIFSK